MYINESWATDKSGGYSYILLIDMLYIYCINESWATDIGGGYIYILDELLLRRAPLLQVLTMLPTKQTAMAMDLGYDMFVHTPHI